MESFLNCKERHRLIPNRRNAPQKRSQASCRSAAVAVITMEWQDLTLFFSLSPLRLEPFEEPQNLLIHLIKSFHMIISTSMNVKHLKTVALS